MCRIRLDNSGCAGSSGLETQIITRFEMKITGVISLLRCKYNRVD